jgi:hypothetical protein
MTHSVTYCSDYLYSRSFRRREILRLGSLGLLGMSLPELIAARAEQKTDDNRAGFGRAKACIMLFMWGGPAHQDTWDMKPDAPVEVRGEFKPISTNVSGIQICEHFPELAKRTDKLALVRSMTHRDVNHTSSTHYLLTGQPPPKNTDLRAQWPHVGSVLGRLKRGHGVLPPFVSMRPKLENTVPRFVEQSQGQFAGWLGPVHDPLTIDHDPSRKDYRIGELTLRRNCRWRGWKTADGCWPSWIVRSAKNRRPSRPKRRTNSGRSIC